jgi:hypothetical protein
LSFELDVSELGATGFEPVASKSQRKSSKSVTETPQKPLAHSLARESQKCPIPAPSTSPSADPIDTDLARLIAAWPGLSATAKRMILAAVEAEKG